MGSASKIILIGATSLIVGIYAVSLKKVQANDINTALVEVKRVQFERVQAAALSTALSSFVSFGAVDLVGSKTQLGGDTTFTYSFTSYGDYAYLTMTVYQRNFYTDDHGHLQNVLVPRVITATVEYTYGYGVKQGPRKIHRAMWQVSKYYVQRES
jgi:hypothetical protein